MLNHTYTQKPYYYTNKLKCSDYIYNFQKSHTRTIYITTKDDSIDLKYIHYIKSERILSD